MKIGIYGGSFNPPHKAHIKLVNTLLKNKIVDKVIILPTSSKYNKSGLLDASIRVKMIKLCFNSPNIVVEDISVINQQDYTIKTLEYYQRLNPKDEICFIMGSDNMKIFHLWNNFREIIKGYELIVILRNGDKIEDLKNLHEDAKITFVTPINNYSSTDIRNKLKNNIKPEELTEEVYQYIVNHNLYNS